jgi:N-acylneuraminate cytidylyltransferase
MKSIALIPARSGSKRVPNKNIKPLAGHPLMAYTIAAAKQSRVFDAVVVSTDSSEYVLKAVEYGAGYSLRPKALATDASPDIKWVKHIPSWLDDFDVFSILRPTSPFRTADTIMLAMEKFLYHVCNRNDIDSLRAVQECSQHPCKMWKVGKVHMKPLVSRWLRGSPMHSNPTQVLPKVYVQNASLEIAWTKTVLAKGSISGDKVVPFFTQGYEGFDINTEEDFRYAEYLVETGQVELPKV